MATRKKKQSKSDKVAEFFGAVIVVLLAVSLIFYLIGRLVEGVGAFFRAHAAFGYSLLAVVGLLLVFVIFRKIYKAAQNRRSRAQIAVEPEPYTPVRSAPPVIPSPEDIILPHQGNHDILLPEAVDFILETGISTPSALMRKQRIAYSRAARIIDQAEEIGIVGPFAGSQPRDILITKEQWRALRPHLLTQTEQQGVDLSSIIDDENEWRREQRGQTPVEAELYKIDYMDGAAFERWCADLLRRAGFQSVTLTSLSNDQGADILAVKDGVKYAIQCKCYSQDLGNTPVQEVHAAKAIYHCHVGVVMTNRRFTSGGKAAAEATGTLLWDRDVLAEMLGKSSTTV